MSSLSEIKRRALDVRELLEATNNFEIVESVWSKCYQQTDLPKIRMLQRLAEDAAYGQVARLKEVDNDRHK